LLLLSLSVHEWAHAWSAHKLGDDTAERMGRLTLNPLAHMDPIGTFLLPLLGIPFGWAKPVPVDPTRFRRNVSQSAGMAITAAAGPISNLILAVLCAVVFGLLLRFKQDLAAQPGVVALLVGGMSINVALAIFNLLPIPPLDGSRIVAHFIPAKSRESWDAFQRFAPFVLLGVIAFGGMVLAGPISAINGALMNLIQTISGA
jgi:Zn-dependent protease